MAITIRIPNPINISLQAKPIGVAEGKLVETGGWDIIYFTKINQNTKQQEGEIKRVGVCVGVTPGATHYYISIEPDAKAETPEEGDFLFFGKNNKIGVSGVKGYHAVVDMRNTTGSRAELYCVASDITLSSK